MGGNRLSYEGHTTTQCARLITTKVLLNSVVSIILMRFMSASIHDFNYNTPMEYYEYMKTPLIVSTYKSYNSTTCSI